jgi:hypothetical protein
LRGEGRRGGNEGRGGGEGRRGGEGGRGVPPEEVDDAGDGLSERLFAVQAGLL